MNHKIDLHIHSNKSDGTLSPIQIIDEAVKNNVKTISITDHDTIEAYTKDIYEYAHKNSIKLIPGVEISTKTKRCGIHILGYNFDLNNSNLINKLSTLRNVRHNYLHKVAEKLKQLGYTVNTEKLDAIEAVTKAHISEDIITNQDNRKTWLNNFGHIPTKGEFIETLLNEKCPAYVKKDSISPSEAAQLIKNAGGKVILAHPVAYKYEDNLTDEEILNIIKNIKPDGIESHYIYIDRQENKINEIDKWNNYAKQLNLITTIGSDFHTKDNIHPQIGLINENINLPTNNIISNLEN